MTIDPNKWIKTLPNNNLNDKSNENNADHEKWISTIPKKNNIKFKKILYYFIFQRMKAYYS